MAAQHHKSEQVSTKARRYIVGYIRDQRKFGTGRKVEVLWEQGELIIRLAEE
ncbi:hypothetical protein [Yersinia pseudotuberculosis]|uniref:Type I toxin-antitoxin system SymE family toxin n=2 Tax=Yersinia pseudotuberculosis TaxID=633 RepID=A0ABM7AK95_YERPU|nr:hypothetical protein [Yersinia pseudotuberculosis]AJJ57662.1 hypothetical protein BZ22_2192 [Yersinia pseudotuberculosis YPIII]AYW87629.1 type I toxin-antitoxin system SymE family toxin [Yersinia pseudotuberculosis]AYW92707.1 type I toxin-antitoxin system SymE family toxin [Yersinia pseudotuberculosis]AYW96929.1 type I toxin-antitoxin system SymE family toxin [Yersinia pseudotuberculosis]AYX02182.1 type I toxin-antitoxin system SymE family toxin [Yersinia pseudotuberculosis]